MLIVSVRARSAAAKLNMVLLLVFRTLTPNRASLRFLSSAKVARCLKLSYGKVYHICQKARNGPQTNKK